jgi:hypothetical protein
MESNKGSTYQYTPLRERGAIRIISLQPSPDVEAQVECSLDHTTLYDCDADTLNHYVALSYAWGDAQDTTAILVDGIKLDITVNLDSALRYVRDKSRPRKVWADAVCINQQDLEERAIQVQQMGEVYRTALRTIIYLGRATGDSDDVFDYVSQQHKNSFADVPLTASLSEPRRLKVHDVISRPWFKRVWIFQELLLSRDPWLQCGEAKAPWDCFARYLLTRPDAMSDHQDLRQADQTFLDMHASRTEFLKRDDCEERDFAQIMMNLLNYMTKRRGFGVTDPLDMVYAHLGISGHSLHGEQKASIRIDYTRTIKQVYEEFTASMIRSAPSFGSVLSCAESDIEFDQRCHDLASWCPDCKCSHYL